MSEAVSADTSWSSFFYDGISNRKRPVTLRFSDALDIVEDNAVIASWPYDHVRRIDDFNGLRLSAISASPLARLEIKNEAVALEVEIRCKDLDQDNGNRQTGRIIGWSLAAACSIVLIILYGIPLIAERLAPLIPQSVEKRLGEVVDRQVRAIFDKACDDQDGQRALVKMIDKINNAAEGETSLQAHVLSSSIPNAVALPGGKIYLFNGLLQRAQNPDEIAGVLAHEIGHHKHRDGLRGLIRAGGTSFMIGLLFGDITGSSAMIFVAQSILNASHSREAETSADDVAIMAMTRLGRSPTPMGDLLVRVTGTDQRGSIIDSHPVSAERRERMKSLDIPPHGEPILSDEEWSDLKGICETAD